MNRTERVRQVVDEVLWGQPDVMERRAGFIHLYGVAQACALLALVRGLDAELGTIAGMLHDLWTYKTGDPTDHAQRGAELARKVLSQLSCFSEHEIEILCQAVAHHRVKGEVHGAYDELLKDADVLSHYFYNTQFEPIEKERTRLAALREEFGIEEGKIEFTDITAGTAPAFFTCLSCQSAETCAALTPHQMARQQWHAAHEHMGLKAKVLMVDGAAVGRCHYGPIELSPLVGRDTTVILCLYVHMHGRPLSDQRGRGYGRAMLEAVESDARTSGAQAVAAWATDGSWYPVSFYLHAGYTEVDREDGVIAVWKPFSTQAEPPRLLRLPDPPPFHADRVTVLVADNDWCSGGRMKRIAREAVAGLEAITDYVEVGPPYDGRIISFGTVGGIFVDGEAYRPDKDIRESSDLRRCIVELHQRKCPGEPRIE